jgi:cytochrome P450
MEDPPAEGRALVPFSEGPVVCPGRNLVQLLTTAMLAAILENTEVRLRRPVRLKEGEPLPATLNHFGMRFELRRRPVQSRANSLHSGPSPPSSTVFL